MATLLRRLFKFNKRNSRSHSKDKNKINGRHKIWAADEPLFQHCNDASSNKTVQASEERRVLANSKVTTVRTRRLLKEYGDICKYVNSFKQKNLSTNSEYKLPSQNSVKPPFTVELIDDSLYHWSVKVYQFDSSSQMSKDMLEQNIDYILFHVSFPNNFPFHPPFIRVVEPEIEKGKSFIYEE